MFYKNLGALVFNPSHLNQMVLVYFQWLNLNLFKVILLSLICKI